MYRMQTEWELDDVYMTVGVIGPRISPHVAVKAAILLNEKTGVTRKSKDGESL